MGSNREKSNIAIAILEKLPLDWVNVCLLKTGAVSEEEQLGIAPFFGSGGGGISLCPKLCLFNFSVNPSKYYSIGGYRWEK